MLEAIVIGFFLGLSVTLPLSLAGAVLLIGALANFPLEGSVLLIVKIAILLGILVASGREIFSIMKKSWRAKIAIILATIFAIAVMLLIELFVSNLFKITFLGFGLLLTGTAILVSVKTTNQENLKLKNLKILPAVGVGISFGFSVLPGVSGLGASMAFGKIFGLEKTEAINFSYAIFALLILVSSAFDLINLNISKTLDFARLFAVSLSAFLGTIFGAVIMKKTTIKSWNFFAFLLFVLSAGALVFCYCL